MANDARVSLYGRVIAEPRNSQVNNSTVVSFPLAVKTTRKQEKNPEYYDDDIYQISVWGKPSEYLVSNLHTGATMVVNGDLMMRSFKDRNGNERQQLACKADWFKVVSTGNAAARKKAAPQQSDDDDPLAF